MSLKEDEFKPNASMTPFVMQIPSQIEIEPIYINNNNNIEC